MPLGNIPGYYYDEERGRYFKIESRSTTPSTASWSTESVKKRLQSDLDRERRERKRNRAALCQPIRLSPAAAGRCFAGDKLRLECEGVTGLEERGRELVDARAKVWAEGLEIAGTIRLGQVRGYDTRISAFEVVTGDVERLAYVYAVAQSPIEEVLFGKYAPTDHHGRLCYDVEKTGIKNYPINMGADWAAPPHNVNALGYNPSKKVFYASCVPGRNGRRTPPICFGEADPLRPGVIARARLHLNHGLRDAPMQDLQALIETYTAPPAPHNSPALCYVGTSAGAVQVSETGSWRLLRHTRRYGSIFTVDCSHLNPNLVFTGGRKGIVAKTDIRSMELAGEFLHGTAVTHLRIAPDGNEHRILVAGVNNTMAIYDRRWLGGPQKALPVLTFPEYRNEARPLIGFDLCAEAGVVVAAEDTGAVGLFSVASGKRVGELPLGNRVSNWNPVQCLRVRKLGGEAMPSVFVGVGTGIVKFSWRINDDDEH